MRKCIDSGQAALRLILIKLIKEFVKNVTDRNFEEIASISKINLYEIVACRVVIKLMTSQE